MKLINTEFGQTIHLVVMDEIRPPSGIYLPDFIEAIRIRYRFLGWPPNINELIAAGGYGAKFQAGVAQIGDKQIPINELSLWNDGFIASARNTSDSNIVLDEFITWTTDQFGFEEPITPPKRLHSSSVIVEFEKSIDNFIRDFAIISSIVADAVNIQKKSSHVFNVFRIAISADQTETKPLLPPTFSIEQRAGHSPKDRRYFSNAPLTTDTHLALLESIERYLSSGPDR
jgi:hypothetical protein